MKLLCLFAVLIITFGLVTVTIAFPRKRKVEGLGVNKRDAMSVILDENENMNTEDVDEILIEGDIAIGKKGAANALRDVTKLWPNGVVPYVFDDTYSESFKPLVLDGFRHYHERTCIRFKERTTEDDFIKIKEKTGCWSYVGRIGGRQTVSLPGGCQTLGTVIHELMHALGFFHEQSRTDRDEYVTILRDNIMDGKFESNFETYTHAKIDDLGADYDYKSVMHYESTAFSKNGKATIVPKTDVGLIDRDYFSQWDLYKINKLYNCGMTGLENKVLPGTGECYEGWTGADYRGTVSTTKTGRQCKHWSEYYDYDSITRSEMGILDNNYCRNHENSPVGPWCYTTDGSWDYCDVGKPGENCQVETSECFTSPRGTDYRGTKSTTISGFECLSWASLEHEGDGNYCRNPDNDSTAWCYYTTDYTYEHCDIGQPSHQC